MQQSATAANQVTLIVVAVISGIIGPLLLAAFGLWVNKLNRAADKRDRVETDKSVEVVHASVGVVHEKLDVIHTLVNSSLTAAIHGELAATVREASLLREVIELRRRSGLEPSAETLRELAEVDEKIAALILKLAERVTQTHLADAQAEAQRQGRVEPNADTGLKSP